MSPMLKESLTFHSSIIDSITDDVYEELNVTSPGPRFTPIKLGAEFITPSLARLFQQTLSTIIGWISANIVPVHKKGD